MHAMKAEILAAYFDTTTETMLRHCQTSQLGLFKVMDKHYTCVSKGYPVPTKGFTYVAEVMHNGAAFTVYRTHPKASRRLA